MWLGVFLLVSKRREVRGILYDHWNNSVGLEWRMIQDKEVRITGAMRVYIVKLMEELALDNRKSCTWQESSRIWGADAGKGVDEVEEVLQSVLVPSVLSGSGKQG